MGGERRGWSKFYLPEIHDVHPAMDTSIEALLEALPETARSACTFLVVPNWQDRACLVPDDPLAASLRSLPGVKVLHGWTHSLGPSLGSWLLHGHDDRSEFAHLTEEAARSRLRAAKTVFVDSLGEAPEWFCAPQWRLGEATAAILQQEGLRHVMFADRLELDGRHAIPMAAVNFDVGDRRPVQWINAALRQRAIARLMRLGTPFRLVIHPVDRLRERIWPQLTGLIRQLDAEGWEALDLGQTAVRWHGRS